MESQEGCGWGRGGGRAALEVDDDCGGAGGGG